MMAEFTVQFDQHVLAMDFSAAPAPMVKFVKLSDPAMEMELMRHRHTVESTLISIAGQLERDAEAISGLREQLQQTVIRYAECVAKTVFTQKPELIAQRLKEQLLSGIAAIESTDEVHVWIHPDCLATAEQLRIDSDLNFLLHADPLLEAGDCRIESAGNGLIARLNKRLEIARNELLGPDSTGADRP